MKGLSLITNIVALVALLFGGWQMQDGRYFHNRNSLTKKCHYMAYGFGDCYPQWRVDSNDAVNGELNELTGRGI